MNRFIEDDEEGLIALLKSEAPEASHTSLALWRERLLWAAKGGPMGRDDWKRAQKALADLRGHLAAAEAAEASLPSWLRECIAYREPVASTAAILARAVLDLEGKIALGEAIVSGHFERNPPRRGNPSFAYSEAQLAVARTAAVFWEEAAGKVVATGRDADGFPTTDFGRFLDVALDKLDMEGNPALLAEKVVASIPD